MGDWPDIAELFHHANERQSDDRGIAWQLKTSGANTIEMLLHNLDFAGAQDGWQFTNRW
ncbi:MAG TPA: hypothetical protein VLM42_04260 [Bryobacteraceae bacterium]|nr:hypothetical protein [Bryobacteraceae bacterium]